MALSLNDRVALAEDLGYQKKIRIQMLAKVADVLYEYQSATFVDLPNKAKIYVNTANAIKGNIDYYLRQFIDISVSDAAYDDLTPDDTQIQTVVAAVFPIVAGLIFYDR